MTDKGPSDEAVTHPWVCLPPNQQLLSKPKFSCVEKIKTIGSTYMAAAGLCGAPGQENNQVGGATGLVGPLNPHCPL